MLKVPFDIVTSGKEADNEKTFLMGSQKGQETEKHWCSKFQKSYIWVWTLLLAVIFLLILYVLNPYRDSDSFPVNLLNTGDRIQLKSVHSGHYIRVSDATGSLVLDQTIPWKRGSTFEVEAAGECFLLRSLTGKFIRVDNEGIIRSASAQRYGATHFAAITKYENTPIAEVSDRSEDQPLAQVHLKVCKKNLWLQEISQMSANIPPAENNSKENQKKDGKSKSPVFSGTTSRDAEELKLKEMVSDVDSENENENVENESATPLQRLPVRLTNIIVTAPVDTTAMSFGKPTISTGINYRSAVIELKRRFRRLTDFNSNNEDNNENSENNQSNVGPGSIGMKSARPLLTAFEVLPVPQIRGE